MGKVYNKAQSLVLQFLLKMHVKYTECGLELTIIISHFLQGEVF